MRYTYRRYAGILCIILSIFIISRVLPPILWYIVLLVLVGTISYLLYSCFFN